VAQNFAGFAVCTHFEAEQIVENYFGTYSCLWACTGYIAWVAQNFAGFARKSVAVVALDLAGCSYHIAASAAQDI